MPIYELRCTFDACAIQFERVTLKATSDHGTCACGAPLEQVFSASIKTKGFEPFYNPALGAFVYGRGDEQQIARRNRLVEAEPPRKGDLSARLDRVHERKREAAHRGESADDGA